jgi:hypothetical protein
MRSIAAVLVVIFVFVQALAVSSPLHRLFHPDATAPTHACVVTLLAHGQIALAAATVPIPVPARFELPAPRTALSLAPAADYHLLPGRGPPAT